MVCALMLIVPKPQSTSHLKKQQTLAFCPNYVAMRHAAREKTSCRGLSSAFGFFVKTHKYVKGEKCKETNIATGSTSKPMKTEVLISNEDLRKKSKICLKMHIKGSARTGQGLHYLDKRVSHQIQKLIST